MNHGLRDVDKQKELVRLHRMGMEKRAIARVLRMSPSTEQKYRKKLDAAGILRGDPDDLPEVEALVAVCESTTQRPKQERSSVEPWRHRIEALVAKNV